MEQALTNPIDPIEQTVTELSELGKIIVRKAIKAYESHFISLDTSGMQESGNMDDCKLTINEDCKDLDLDKSPVCLTIVKWYEGFASTSVMLSSVSEIAEGGKQ